MRKYIGILALLILCAGCSNKEPIKVPSQVQELAASVQKEHEQIQKKPIEEALYADEHDLDAYFKTFRYLIDHTGKHSPERTFSYREAKADVDQLFDIFKTVYGNYEAFGGDEIFQKAQEDILYDLSLEEPLTYDYFSYVLRHRLSFIQDSHVQIDYQDLHRPMLLYGLKNPVAFKKKDGVYELSGREVKAMNGKRDLDTYLKPSLQQGKVSYDLYIQTRAVIDHVQVTYADGTTKDLELAPITPAYDENASFHTATKQSIPYMALTRMAFPELSEDSAEEVEEALDYAKELQDSPVAILDLRGNTGGNQLLVDSWCKAFTGEQVQGNIISMLKLPLTDKRFTTYGIDWSQDPAEVLKQNTYQKLNDLIYIGSNNIKDKKMIDSDTILFVLQDGYTASAAESLIDYLHNVKKVIFVGTPTRGMITGSSFMTIYMEHTSLQVSIGNLSNSADSSYAREYYGIQPDLWVQGDALEAVLSLFK